MKTLFGKGKTKFEYLDLNEGVKDQVAISFMLLFSISFCLRHTQPFMQDGFTIFPSSDQRH